MVLGDVVAYHPALLKPKRVAARAAFVRAFVGPGPRLPSGVETSARASAPLDDRLYLALGYPVIGGKPVRADIVERVAKRVREAKDALEALPLAAWLAMPPRDALAVGRALDHRTC
ncbi:MAG: hypothetical protein U0414_18030 [Polyangiaceae bacterium]